MEFEMGDTKDQATMSTKEESVEAIKTIRETTRLGKIPRAKKSSAKRTDQRRDKFHQQSTQ